MLRLTVTQRIQLAVFTKTNVIDDIFTLRNLRDRRRGMSNVCSLKKDLSVSCQFCFTSKYVVDRSYSNAN